MKRRASTNKVSEHVNKKQRFQSLPEDDIDSDSEIPAGNFSVQTSLPNYPPQDTHYAKNASNIPTSTDSQVLSLLNSNLYNVQQELRVQRKKNERMALQLANVNNFLESDDQDEGDEQETNILNAKRKNNLASNTPNNSGNSTFNIIISSLVSSISLPLLAYIGKQILNMSPAATDDKTSSKFATNTQNNSYSNSNVSNDNDWDDVSMFR